LKKGKTVGGRRTKKNLLKRELEPGPGRKIPAWSIGKLGRHSRKGEENSNKKEKKRWEGEEVCDGRLERKESLSKKGKIRGAARADYCEEGKR